MLGFVCLGITGEQEIQFSHLMRQDAVLVWTTSVRTCDLWSECCDCMDSLSQDL